MSGIFKLGWADLLKGLLVAVLAAVFAGLLAYVAKVQFSGDPALNALMVTSLSTLLGYLLKNLATDSQGNILALSKANVRKGVRSAAKFAGFKK
jgi:ABC-type uncharacterized transport system permease subunit